MLGRLRQTAPGLLRTIPRRNMAIQQWTVGPAVLPALSDAEIAHNLTDANQMLMQVCTAHMSGQAEWLHEQDEEKLRKKMATVMIELRDSGRAVPAPDCSPIFGQMCEHSGLPMPLDGFMQTSTEMTQLQLDYIMDEMRGFPGRFTAPDPSQPHLLCAQSL